MTTMPRESSLCLVWFRHDLRLADHPALSAAIRKHNAVIPFFLWSPQEEGDWRPGAASRWWYHQSLKALDQDLRERGSRLVLRQGDALKVLSALVAETGAQAVYWNRRYEPRVVGRDDHVRSALAAQGLEVETFNGSLLHEPATIQTKANQPFQVFTPYWKTCLALGDPESPLPKPRRLAPPTKWPDSIELNQLKLEPTMPWAEGFHRIWQPGEAGAQRNLRTFLTRAAANYDEHRNRPDLAGTSRLSPHLHFGEISPRQIWHALQQQAEGGSNSNRSWRHGQFVTELGWREFAHHLLHHFPHTPEQPLRSQFNHFPWSQSPDFLAAWQRGRTGYPFVDAGLRELWTTGWMHNRVRMVVASFLVKHLRLPWPEGARWFWDTLVDADLANNTLGWQWTAGCGADAAPFFRIFNPVSQGHKFDPHGDYVRRWVPELHQLPTEVLHEPWQAKPDVLDQAKVRLGETYPRPIVSHFSAREAALEAYARMKKRGNKS